MKTVTPFNRQAAQKESALFKALGHPMRLWIVRQLSEGERCVCELVESSGADFSTVSKHLTLLKHHGIVQDDKRGKSVFYTLCCPCLIETLNCLFKKPNS